MYLYKTGEKFALHSVHVDVELPGGPLDDVHVARHGVQLAVGVPGRLAPGCHLAGRLGVRDVTQWGHVEVGGVTRSDGQRYMGTSLSERHQSRTATFAIGTGADHPYFRYMTVD